MSAASTRKVRSGRSTELLSSTTASPARVGLARRADTPSPGRRSSHRARPPSDCTWRKFISHGSDGAGYTSRRLATCPGTPGMCPVPAGTYPCRRRPSIRCSAPHEGHLASHLLGVSVAIASISMESWLVGHLRIQSSATVNLRPSGACALASALEITRDSSRRSSP